MTQTSRKLTFTGTIKAGETSVAFTDDRITNDSSVMLDDSNITDPNTLLDSIIIADRSVSVEYAPSLTNDTEITVEVLVPIEQ